MSENRTVHRSTNAAPAKRPAQNSGRKPAQSTARRPAQGSGRPQQRRRKKKKSYGGLIAVLLVVVIAVVGIILISGRNKGNNTGNGTPVAAAPTLGTEAGQANTGEENNTVKPVTPAPTIGAAKIVSLRTTDLGANTELDSTWRSILLCGTDARLWDDMKHTDTMIIACYNLKTGSIRMISVMRDIFVDISKDVSGRGNVRLNTVSAFGGMELLIRKLNQFLGLNIREYMLVDFAGFVEVVNLMGGIDMDITEVEMQYINSSLTEQVNLLVDKTYRKSVMEECTLSEYGPNIHLNGLQSLAFARTRKSDNDFKRTDRQRKVIVAAAHKAIDTVTIPQVAQMVNIALQYVETNISVSGVVQLGMGVMTKGIDDIQSTRLPVDNSYKGEKRNNVWGMYDMDWNVNKAEVQRLLNGY